MDVKELAVQIDRLIVKWPRAFDEETVKLIKREVLEMSDADFTYMVDHFLGTRPHTRPPLMPDFREARLAIEKTRFTKTVKQAARAVEQEGERRAVKDLMAEHKVSNLTELFELARLQKLTEPDPGPDGAA